MKQNEFEVLYPASVRFVILYLGFFHNQTKATFSLVSLFVQALVIRKITLRQFLLLSKVSLAREKSRVAIVFQYVTQLSIA